jgi:hypothetical protein
MVAALERSSGRSIPGELVLSTLAGRLLSSSSAPSLHALRAALAALGHAVNVQELRAMGTTDLRQRIIEVRNAPAVSQHVDAAM